MYNVSTLCMSSLVRRPLPAFQCCTCNRIAGSGLGGACAHACGTIAVLALTTITVVNICKYTRTVYRVHVHNTVCYIPLRLRTAKHRPTPAIIRAPLFSPSVLSTNPAHSYTGGISNTDRLWVQPMGSARSVA